MGKHNESTNRDGVWTPGGRECACPVLSPEPATAVFRVCNVTVKPCRVHRTVHCLRVYRLHKQARINHQTHVSTLIHGAVPVQRRTRRRWSRQEDDLSELMPIVGWPARKVSGVLCEPQEPRTQEESVQGHDERDQASAHDTAETARSRPRLVDIRERPHRSHGTSLRPRDHRQPEDVHHALLLLRTSNQPDMGVHVRAAHRSDQELVHVQLYPDPGNQTRTRHRTSHSAGGPPDPFLADRPGR